MQVLDIVDAAEADTGSSLLQLEVVMREHMHRRWDGVERRPGHQQDGYPVMACYSRGSDDPAESEQLAGHRVRVLRDPLRPP